jgi:hypothetical protein
MEINKERLESWILKMPECEGFFDNFFKFYKESNTIYGMINYLGDIEHYSRDDPFLRKYTQGLLQAYEDITGLRIYFNSPDSAGWI